jgi:hypothetical protein
VDEFRIADVDADMIHLAALETEEDQITRLQSGKAYSLPAPDLLPNRARQVYPLLTVDILDET